MLPSKERLEWLTALNTGGYGVVLEEDGRSQMHIETDTGTVARNQNGMAWRVNEISHSQHPPIIWPT